MRIRPLRPLILPGIFLLLFVGIALFIPTYHHIDALFIQLVQALPNNYEQAALLIAKIGDPLPLVIVALGVAGWELYRRHYVRALVMSASLLAMPAFFLVKELIHRARPVSEYVLQHGLHDYSFPSGHSTGSMAVYGMIFVLASSHLAGKVRLLIMSVCTLVIVLVGMTRVYLGAHFPTDVLGGWLLGLTIVTLLRSLSLAIAKHSDTPNREAIEDTTEEPEAAQ
jgi:undecaprenyl-diphosphatase